MARGEPVWKKFLEDCLTRQADGEERRYNLRQLSKEVKRKEKEFRSKFEQLLTRISNW